MTWLRETTRHVRIGVFIPEGEDCVMASIDDKVGRRARYQGYALEPWEARQFALALNGAAELLDPGGSAEPPTLRAEEAHAKIT